LMQHQLPEHAATGILTQLLRGTAAQAAPGAVAGTNPLPDFRHAHQPQPPDPAMQHLLQQQAQQQAHQQREAELQRLHVQLRQGLTGHPPGNPAPQAGGLQSDAGLQQLLAFARQRVAITNSNTFPPPQQQQQQQHVASSPALDPATLPASLPPVSVAAPASASSSPGSLPGGAAPPLTSKPPLPSVNSNSNNMTSSMNDIFNGISSPRATPSPFAAMMMGSSTDSLWHTDSVSSTTKYYFVMRLFWVANGGKRKRLKRGGQSLPVIYFRFKTKCYRR